MIYKNMVAKSGRELKFFVGVALDNPLTQPYKERFILKDLHKYVTAPNDKKVCCLYGLRRTGKTTMALQEIRNLNDYSNTLFIGCSSDKTMWDLRTTIDAFLTDNPNCKYIFIDEITSLQEFINTCSFLADDFATRGIKVVLSGTDSLGFWIAKHHELYDREHTISTTYIPYKEFKYLLDKDLDDYIEYGGTLTTGIGRVFCDDESTKDYIDTAIVDNIQSSLKKWNRGENIGAELLSKIIDQGNEFKSAVNKVLELHNHSFLAKRINKDFETHDVGSLIDLMIKHKIADPSFLDTDEIKNRVRECLEIEEKQFYTIDKDTVDSLVDYLIKLDVLYQIPKIKNLDKVKNNEYIFTQVGMRYIQAKQQAEALSTSDAFSNYDIKQQREILKKLDEDIRGGILEDIVFSQFAKEIESLGKKDNPYKISKYRNSENKEIDVLVLDFAKESVLAVEIKHSSEMTRLQTEHLRNETLCAEINELVGMPITNKVVVYRGNNGESEDGILYINASYLLEHSKEIFQVLLEHPQITSFSQLEYIIKNGTVGNSDEHSTKLSKEKPNLDIYR